jgi:hypothetical protein
VDTDLTIINAYNEKNQKLVSSDLLIVDAAAEPLRVLKVLVEGLPPGGTGLWLNNFKGIPVARTLSPFDLIYLDQTYQVVHCVEISTEGEYEPFRGEPASALVVPPKSIASSKLRPGDRLQFRAIDPSAEPPAPRSKSSRRQKQSTAPSSQPVGAHFYNSAFPVPPTDGGGGTLPGFLAGQNQNAPGAATATASSEHAPGPISGRLGKTANSLLDTTPAFRPSTGESSQPGFSMGALATAPSAPPVEVAYSVKAPTRLISTEHLVETKSVGPVSSGRLMRSVNLAPAILPLEEPEPPAPAIEPAQQEVTPAAAVASGAQAPALANSALAVPAIPDTHREPTHGIVIPITTAPDFAIPPSAPAVEAPAPAHLPTVATEPAAPAAPSRTEPQFATLRSNAAPGDLSKSLPARSAPSPIASATAAAMPTLVPPPPPRIVEAPISLAPAPLQTTAQPAPEPTAADAVLAIKAEPSPYPRTQIKLAEQQQSLAVSQKKKKPSWDVRLLYTLFPEFDPSRPPEIRIPRAGEKKEDLIEDEEELSTKLKLLCWLYPDLHLDKHKQRRSEERRAVRLPMPGLVAYFFTGGSPRPHPIKDISLTGFYMITNERWLPGTIIRITLQMINARPDGGRDSVTVHSRVVRWGPDGGGFEFVLPGFLEQ